MKENKNIERLFQEKLKDFEAQPPQNAWDNIEANLSKKKKRRVFPLWLKASGVAAILFLSIWIFIPKHNVITNKTTEEKNNVVTKEEINKEEVENTPLNLEDETIDYNKNKALVERDNTVKSTQEEVTKGKINNKKGNFATQENLVNVLQQEGDVVVEDKPETSSKALTNNLKTLAPIAKSKITDKINKAKYEKGANSPSIIAKDIEIQKDTIQIANTEKKEHNKLENELEKHLKEKEEGKNADEKEAKRSKWVVSTNAAPVYFNSMTKGSPLDEQFASNTKNFNMSYSYGVGVAYKLSKKLDVRAGINNVALDYDTHDVYYSPILNNNIASAKMNSVNINRDDIASNLYLYNKSTDEYAVFEYEVKDQKGKLNQEIAYLEVPLELSYKVIDKKLGIAVIGGMSTLFLTDNAITLHANNMQMEIGEANNLSSVSFSGNLGVGLNYSFWKSFNINLEPTFKYQFKTFSNNAGNFKPYIIGVYTGLSYQF